MDIAVIFIDIISPKSFVMIEGNLQETKVSFFLSRKNLEEADAGKNNTRFRK